jgi:hypothetical protein
MVIAIIFSAYDGLREQIVDAEELEIGPTLLRKAILGRDPSLKELRQPLLEIAKRKLTDVLSGNRATSRKWPCFLPKSQVVDPRMKPEPPSPERFSDAHLLELFDPQHIFRTYGILSPRLENEIMGIKTLVAKQRAHAEKKAAAADPRRAGNVTSRKDSREEDVAVKDPWALDREEFCALLHALNESNAMGSQKFEIGEDTDEMQIADLIFSAYGRKHGGKAGDGTFRKRVMEKLDKITRFCEPAEVKEKRSAWRSRTTTTQPDLGGDGSNTLNSRLSSFMDSNAPKLAQAQRTSDAQKVKEVQFMRRRRLLSLEGEI